jgi:hypothetical protein
MLFQLSVGIEHLRNSRRLVETAQKSTQFRWYGRVTV